MGVIVGVLFSFTKGCLSQGGAGHPLQPLSPAAHQADPLSHFTARQDLSQKAHSQETSDASNNSEVMQKMFYVY